MVSREIVENYQEKREADRVFDHVFFDVDSCVVGIEGIDELAKIGNCLEEVAALTHVAMNGNGASQYYDSLVNRLGLIKPRREHMPIIAQKYIESVTPGVPEVIRILQSKGVRVWFLSGGFGEAIYPLADHLGVSRGQVFANHLYFHPDGTYAGFDETTPLARSFGKREYIRALKEYGIVKGKTVIVGDGIAEAEAREVTDFCIGFGGHVVRNNVRARADVFIEEKTFLPLLPFLLNGQENLSCEEG